MTKLRLLRYICFVILCILLFPIAPLLMGIFAIYKIIKSNLPKKNKWLATILIVITAFTLTGKITKSLPVPTSTSSPSPSANPTPEVLINQNALPTASPIPNPNITFAKVKNVVDGDTFTLESGQVIRMIGIDTPETVHPSKPIQCYGKEASNKTKELIEGKEVRLEKDVSETDKYKRLLRYVYINDLLVNEVLVSEGYAKSSSYPPDIKYQDKFIEAEKKAQVENKGLWNLNSCLTNSPTPKPISTVKPTTTTVIQPAETTTVGSFTCDCSKTCANLTCSEAQYQLTTCRCSARDNDGDGTACDAQCQ